MVRSVAAAGGVPSDALWSGPTSMAAEKNHFSVGPARPDQLEQLSEIWLELMAFHAETDPHFAIADDALQRWHQVAREMLAREDGFLFAACIAGRPVGLCLGWVARNPAIYRTTHVGFISELAVARASRRKGIGRALVEAARAWFAERDLAEFQLSTARWNEDAQAFWRAVGGEPLLIRYRFNVE